jgi:ATP-dependent DNA ligase
MLGRAGVWRRLLARAESTLPVGDYAYEVKWDGFRAIMSTQDVFRVRSRRGSTWRR